MDALSKIIDGLLDYYDERYIHLWGAVRELHRHKQPTREDVLRLIDFIYADRGKLQ